MNLKAEAVGLAVKVELPLIITDIQRAGPSTGMPTKPEQADLLMAMYGRHGESPIPIIAASTPADCFDCAYEAVRIAVKYMTPVILLTDGQLANGAEPWLLPDPRQAAADQGRVRAPIRRASCPTCATRKRCRVRGRFRVLPGLEHRIGGLSSEHLTGNVSYSPANNEMMVRHAGAQDRGDRPRNPARPRSLATQTAATCWWSDGVRPTAPLREAVKTCARQGQERLARPPSLPESAAIRLRRHAAPLQESDGRGDEHGAIAQDGSRRLPDRCGRL